ncbi:hypothetical protein NUACC21_26610 [Scytonema sp. NUACC21]
MPMEAYAILDGGGVKGAALVGCLQAAEVGGIKFIGYGGTSAGSIVALLASVGYSPEQIREIMIEEINFNDFLDGADNNLERFKKIPQGFITSFFKTVFLWQNKDLIDNLNQNLGLCVAKTLTKFLLEKIQKSPKVENSHSDLKQKIQNATDITFQNLKDLGCFPLKVVASDIKRHKAVIYPQNEEKEALNYSVIKAVRASMCFPFVFTPVLSENGNYLVDGGLSSNLPIFLFEKERSINRKPVIAFDLCNSEDISPAQPNKYQLGEFLGDMLATVLESSDDLLRQVIDNIYHVPIPLPQDIGTLDFSIDKEKRERLFDRGYRKASEFIATNLLPWKQVEENTVKRLQALYTPPRLVQPILKTAVRELEERKTLSNCRSYIMLSTDEGKFAIVYQYGMDHDPDIDWEIEMKNEGAWSNAWLHRKPAIQNLEHLRENLSEYNITQAQVNKIPKDKKTTIVVPIFNWKTITLLTDEQYEEFQNFHFHKFQGIIDQYALIGLLSIDTITQTQDIFNPKRLRNVYRSIMVGASILSGILR